MERYDSGFTAAPRMTAALANSSPKEWAGSHTDERFVFHKTVTRLEVI